MAKILVRAVADDFRIVNDSIQVQLDGNWVDVSWLDDDVVIPLTATNRRSIDCRDQVLVGGMWHNIDEIEQRDEIEQCDTPPVVVDTPTIPPDYYSSEDDDGTL